VNCCWICANGAASFAEKTPAAPSTTLAVRCAAAAALQKTRTSAGVFGVKRISSGSAGTRICYPICNFLSSSEFPF
jgi:hypothetical protein